MTVAAPRSVPGYRLGRFRRRGFRLDVDGPDLLCEAPEDKLTQRAERTLRRRKARLVRLVYRERVKELLLPVFRANPDRAVALRDRWAERLALAAADGRSGPESEAVAFADLQSGVESLAAEAEATEPEVSLPAEEAALLAFVAESRGAATWDAAELRFGGADAYRLAWNRLGLWGLTRGRDGQACITTRGRAALAAQAGRAAA